MKHAETLVFGDQIWVQQNHILRRALCQQLLDNDNAFLKAFHKQRENRSVEISAWQPRPGLGEVRVATYISPVSVRCCSRVLWCLITLSKTDSGAASPALGLLGNHVLTLRVCILILEHARSSCVHLQPRRGIDIGGAGSAYAVRMPHKLSVNDRRPLMQAPFSPPETHVHETHRYCVYECGQHLLVELSAAATDLPYSDAFSIETRFDVTQIEVSSGSRCPCHPGYLQR